VASPEPEALVGALPLEAAAEPSGTVGGRSPWRLARERLRNDRVAMVSAVVIVLIVLAALGVMPRQVVQSGDGCGLSDC
jgi:peptide/nickel transport system permease protein